MTQIPEIQLRPARTEDLTEVARLLGCAALPIEDLDEKKLSAFIVATSEGSPVGVVGLEIFETDALLRSLAVTTEQRGKGLGVQLLHAIEAEARRRGVTALYLLTTTAAPYFKQAGYDRFDRSKVPLGIANTREFTDICPNSAACLWRSL